MNTTPNKGICGAVIYENGIAIGACGVSNCQTHKKCPKSSPTTIEAYVESLQKEYFDKFTKYYSGDSGMNGGDPQEATTEFTCYPHEPFEWFVQKLTSLRAETRRQFAEEVIEALEKAKIKRGLDLWENGVDQGLLTSQKIVRSLSTSNQ